MREYDHFELERDCPAFVARKGMVLGETAEIPDIIGPDLLAIADQLLA